MANNTVFWEELFGAIGKFSSAFDPPVLANHELQTTRFFAGSFSEQSPQSFSIAAARYYSRQVLQRKFGCRFYNRLLGGENRQAMSHNKHVDGDLASKGGAKTSSLVALNSFYGTTWSLDPIQEFLQNPLESRGFAGVEL